MLEFPVIMKVTTLLMNNNSYFAQYWGIFYVDIRKEEALTSSVNFS